MSASSTANRPPFLMEGPPGAETVIDGRRVLYFGGTSYFALHGHPEVLRAGREAFRAGVHGATTRTGFGGNTVLRALEGELALFFGSADAVTYASGYLNGRFLIGGLAESHDLAFADEHIHASLREGLAAEGKPVVFYRHGDPGDLGAKLRSKLKAGSRPLVVTDGVFPAFGDIAPLPELLAAIEPYGGLLCLDDAHGAGVLGANGRGTPEHFHLRTGKTIRSAGTLSKAFGGHGGFIAADKAFVRRLRDRVPAYSASTPVATPLAAASVRGLELLRLHPEWRARLRSNAVRLKAGLSGLGFPMNGDPFPVAAWTMRTAAEMRRIQAALFARGIAVALLKYGGAPAGGILRATVFSTHTPAQVDRLISTLRMVL